MLAGIARQAVAHRPLYECDEPRRTLISALPILRLAGAHVLGILVPIRPPHDAPEEALPGRTPGVRVIGDGQAFGHQVGLAMWPEGARAEVERAIEAVQEPGIGVEGLRLHWDAGL